MAERTTSPPVDLPALKQRLGRTGVWLSSLSTVAADEERRAVAVIEELGYGTLWFGEGPTGKEALTHAAVLLSASRRLMIATGIANIYGRDATAAASGANTLSEAWQSRFLLGLGVSHLPLVSGRGHDYGKPVSTMRAYLDAMDATPFDAPLPEPVPRVLAALRPKMLELAATRAQGAHPYFVTPEHTRRAREVLGPDPLLAPEQAVVVDTDPERARATARDYAASYLALPNYLNNLRTLGFSDADFEDGGSDALIDTVVAWGDLASLRERVQEHHRAGADHVAVQPIAQTLDRQLDDLRLLAPVLIP
ncbi:TIGR03620 family F420-dependent LLM class oxidoreductase [Streptantibioticus ferralitis]|uniref:TIGR03620 family F420-dependent LLM class oxidoreductase n=1 Tax=Streptantibioticus ferralitis TaxID=236510 RepID=A0ABT5YU25_9ACTN|nr:TIGR03620 family F420-dependent LLM class oxidoreductase [Streptantibioticus ferralitis]MDF2255111.1 TIGR03620 family F420-dependent LLM class oxidoreductase [Streptantibioticus ferralitis]